MDVKTRQPLTDVPRPDAYETSVPFPLPRVREQPGHEEDIRKTIRLQLEGTAFEIIEAENGEEGIQVLDNENILEMDVIICDIRMPKINGVEAVAYFRKEYPSIPVIVLTGYPDVKLAVDFMKEGVVDYLVKPVEKTELLAAVTKAAEQRSLFSGTQSKM